MTLNDFEWSFSVKMCFELGIWRVKAFWLSEKTVRKFAELRMCCQRQKCSRANAVSSEIKFMRIFAEVSWRGGFKWEWCRRKWRFSLILSAIFSELSHLRSQLLYLLCRPLLALQWQPNRWPWMTFNGLKEIFTGLLNRKHQTSIYCIYCIYTHSSHTCCSLMPVENK